jgi:hypothetical protein
LKKLVLLCGDIEKKTQITAVLECRRTSDQYRAEMRRPVLISIEVASSDPPLSSKSKLMLYMQPQKGPHTSERFKAIYS